MTDGLMCATQVNSLILRALIAFSPTFKASSRAPRLFPPSGYFTGSPRSNFAKVILGGGGGGGGSPPAVAKGTLGIVGGVMTA